MLTKHNKLHQYRISLLLQDIVDYSEKSLPSYSNENAPIDITKILHDFAFREYGQEEFIGKLKRRKAICLLKHSSIPKLKHIIGEILYHVNYLYELFLIKFMQLLPELKWKGLLLKICSSSFKKFQKRKKLKTSEL